MDDQASVGCLLLRREIPLKHLEQSQNIIPVSVAIINTGRLRAAGRIRSRGSDQRQRLPQPFQAVPCLLLDAVFIAGPVTRMVLG
jgi:hypothetical protein